MSAPLIWGIVLCVLGLVFAVPAGLMWEENQPNGWSFVFGFFAVSYLLLGALALGASFGVYLA